MYTKIFKTLFVFIIGIIALNADASSCNFTKDLELGSKGEDVRCLQQYLNNSGYSVSSSGVGSKGKENTNFGDLTKKAVIKWQLANNLTPAEGYFGSKSRVKYNSLTSSTPISIPNSSSSTSLPAGCTSNTIYSVTTGAKCKSDTTTTITTNTNTGTNTTVTLSSAEQREKAIKRIVEAINMMDDADDQIGEGEGDQASAKDNYNDAEEYLLDATRAFFSDKDYEDAYDGADDAYRKAEEAFEDAGGESREDEVENILDKVENELDSAEERIDEADDDDKDVKQSEKLLEQARDKFEQAETAFDKEDYDEAEDILDETSDLIDEAIDSIGEGDRKEDADDAIDDATDAIDDAEDAIDEADDDGEDVDVAKDLLSNAKEKLRDAQDEYDDKDYNNATKLAKKAEELANDAMDEL